VTLRGGTTLKRTTPLSVVVAKTPGAAELPLERQQKFEYDAVPGTDPQPLTAGTMRRSRCVAEFASALRKT
jgi:hypothetical protein